VQAGGIVVRQARISGGLIVPSDEHVHLTRNVAHGGPDAMQWTRVPADTGQYKVRFNKPEGTPFHVAEMDVPPYNAHLPRPDAAPGTYRYSVYEIVDGTEVLRHDPDVILD
jgi:hypothetical protein